jgi:chorismate synthase
MRSNKWDSFIGITTFGESHGPAIGVVLEDIIPGMEFPLEQIQNELNKRRPGKGKFSSPRKEEDKVQVISGVLDGITTGMPICLLVYNKDVREQDYEMIKDIFRPGHADFCYYKKFKIYDYRGGGRASGRETISRVAAAAIVSDLIKPIEIQLYPVQIGNLEASRKDLSFQNELKWPDSSNYDQLIDFLDHVKNKGDSVGGIIHCTISKIPSGLGDPVFEKLDANLAKAVLSIGSVKGIEFGDGFELAKSIGSETNDSISPTGFKSNHAGGISGGISTGQNVEFRFVVKPTPSIKVKQTTVNIKNEKVELELNGRFDTCIIPRIIPVAKAMITLVLADAISYQKQINGKEQSLVDYREVIDKLDEDLLILLKRRMKVAELIGKLKAQDQIQIEDLDREKKLLEAIRSKAASLGLSETFINKIWKLFIEEAKRIQ